MLIHAFDSLSAAKRSGTKERPAKSHRPGSERDGAEDVPTSIDAAVHDNPAAVNPLKLWFSAVLFVVRFGRLFRVTSGVNCVRPRQMGMVSRFLVLSSFVMLRCFTIMASSVGVMFLCFLVVFASILRHFAFPPYHFLKVFL